MERFNIITSKSNYTDSWFTETVHHHLDESEKTDGA